MSKNGPFLALRTTPAVGSVNTLILANADPDDTAPLPRLMYYHPDHDPPEKVLRLGGQFRIEPVSKDLRGLSNFNNRAQRGFAVLKDGSLAIHYQEASSFHYVFELSTGRHPEADVAMLLPPQRLLWEQGDETLELCRF